MQAPEIYRVTISDLESIFGMSAALLDIKGSVVYIICHPQFPNRMTKKIAIKFTDKDGDGFDVYDCNENVEYTNIQGQYPTSIGPALIKNIESIYPIVEKMVSFTKTFHK